MVDEESTWAGRNMQVLVGLLIALVVLGVLVVALGQRWAVWGGFVVALVAAVAFFVNLYQPPARHAAVLAAASPEDRRRAARLLRRQEPVPPRDRRLVDASARGTLRSSGYGAWTGPILAGGNLDALTAPSIRSLFALALLILAIGMTALWLWMLGRARRYLAAHPAEDL